MTLVPFNADFGFETLTLIVKKRECDAVFVTWDRRAKSFSAKGNWPRESHGRPSFRGNPSMTPFAKVDSGCRETEFSGRGK